MNITFTAEFTSIDDFAAFVAGLTSNPASINIAQPQAAPAPVQADDSSPERFYNFKLPAVGTNIHWSGARFDFDGVVDRIDEDTDNMADKCVWVRRNDTGKLVSLTGDDLVSHELTAL